MGYSENVVRNLYLISNGTTPVSAIAERFAHMFSRGRSFSISSRLLTIMLRKSPRGSRQSSKRFKSSRLRPPRIRSAEFCAQRPTPRF